MQRGVRHIDGSMLFYRIRFMLLETKLHNRPLWMAGSWRHTESSLTAGPRSRSSPFIWCGAYTRKDLSPSNVMIQGWKQSGNPRHHPITVNDRRYDDLCHISRHRCLNQSLGRPGMHEHKVGPSPWHQSFQYFSPFWCKYQAFHDDRSLCRFKIEEGAELRKPLPTPTDQMAFKERFHKNMEGGPRPTMKKTYRYIPHEQGRESDPIFHLSLPAWANW